MPSFKIRLAEYPTPQSVDKHIPKKSNVQTKTTNGVTLLDASAAVCSPSALFICGSRRSNTNNNIDEQVKLNFKYCLQKLSNEENLIAFSNVQELCFRDNLCIDMPEIEYINNVCQELTKISPNFNKIKFHRARLSTNAIKFLACMNGNGKLIVELQDCFCCDCEKELQHHDDDDDRLAITNDSIKNKQQEVTIIFEYFQFSLDVENNSCTISNFQSDEKINTSRISNLIQYILGCQKTIKKVIFMDIKISIAALQALLAPVCDSAGGNVVSLVFQQCTFTTLMTTYPTIRHLEWNNICSKTKKLSTIKLQSDTIDSMNYESFGTIMKLLAFHAPFSSIQQLQINKNDIGNIGFDSLVRFLNSTSLQQLNLYDCGCITDAHIQKLSPILKLNKTLTQINLPPNITDIGISCILNVLESGNMTLQFLPVVSYYITNNLLDKVYFYLSLNRIGRRQLFQLMANDNSCLPVACYANVLQKVSGNPSIIYWLIRMSPHYI